MEPPHTESEAPTSATQSTRGSRVDMMMGTAVASGCGLPAIAFHSTSAVSPGGMFTLPTPMQTIKIISVAQANKVYSAGLNLSV